MGAWGYHDNENDQVADEFLNVVDGIDQKMSINDMRTCLTRLDKVQDDLYVGCLISLIGRYSGWQDYQTFPMGYTGLPVFSGMSFDIVGKPRIKKAITLITKSIDSVVDNKLGFSDIDKRKSALESELTFFKQQ